METFPDHNKNTEISASREAAISYAVFRMTVLNWAKSAVTVATYPSPLRWYRFDISFFLI
jgi:hypothetical protein